PRCIKPWIVPNLDPLHPAGCPGGGPCRRFVNNDSTIRTPGISGIGAGGVIGETFNLFADCAAGTSCTPASSTLAANVTGGSFDGNPPPATPNLEYLPGQVPSAFTAVPSCGRSSDYQKAVAGCDQTTVYQCGVASSAADPPHLIDLTNNPGGSGGDTATGVACLIHQTTQGATPSGQDTIDATDFP